MYQSIHSNTLIYSDSKDTNSSLLEGILNEVEQTNNSDNLLAPPVLESFEVYRITDTTDIPDPVVFLKINGETICTEADITAISGSQKSGKSAITAPIVAAAITRDGIIDDPIEGIEVAPNINRKAVIHIDTEQARHKHQRNVKGFLRRGKKDACPEFLLSYNIRELDITQYQEVTTGICRAASEKFGGIHLIVIDGIADYITDVNDQAQSNAIVKYFEQIAIEYRVPIIVILHTNPGSDKERGHLGSQILRKAGSVLTVKCEGDISYLEPKYLRYAGKGNIPLIQFMYDKEKGYHVSCGNRGEGQSFKDFDRIQKLEKLAQKAIAPPAALPYKSVLDRIMKESNKGITSAKSMFTEMKVHEFIIQGDDKNWRFNIKRNDDVV